MASSEKSLPSEQKPLLPPPAPGGTASEQAKPMLDAKSQQTPASAGTDSVKAQTSPWGTPVLAFLAGVCLGGAAGYFLSPAPPLDETRFVNFDPESTPQGLLVSGFSSAETSPNGDTFSWCDSASVRLKVRMRGDGARTLRMRYWPFEYADGPKQ